MEEIMSKELVSIIVVSAKVSVYLTACLDSLKAQDYPYLEIFLVDTSSEADLNQSLAAGSPIITLLHSPNASYCQALNIGIENSKGKFILCLNDDAVLGKGFINESFKGFSINKNVGMVSGKILRFDKQTIDSAGLSVSIWRTAKEKGYGLKDRGQFEKEKFIFGVGGAVAFYRKEMLEQIKLGGEYFDNDFGFFYEDLDVAWRAQRHGFRGYYIPTAVAYHLRGFTARKGEGIDKPFARRFLSNELHARLIRNRYLAMLKNESLSGFLLRLPFIFLYDCASLAFVLLFKRGVFNNFGGSLKCFKGSLERRRLIKILLQQKTI